MSNSTLTLYNIPKITYAKGFMVDDLADYLNSLNNLRKEIIHDFQYMKHGLNVSIKINRPQDWIDDGFIDFNYLKAQNDDGEIYYYFILNKRWISQHTIQLDLKMDVLNSFFIGEHYEFTDKTKIIREHKDRFTKIKDIVSQDYVEVEEDANILWDLMIAYHDKVAFDFNNRNPNQYGFIMVATSDNENNLLLEWYNTDTHSLSNIGECVKVEFVPYSYGIHLVLRNYDGDVIYQADFGNDFFDTHKLVMSVIDYDNIGDNNVDLEYPYTFSSMYIGIEGNKVLRKIDYESEGIHPILYKHDRETINADGRNWYLVYSSQEEPSVISPVKCSLTSDSSFNATFYQDTTLEPLEMVSGTSYMLLYDSLKPMSITLKDSAGDTIRKIESAVLIGTQYGGFTYYVRNIAIKKVSDDDIQVNMWEHDFSKYQEPFANLGDGQSSIYHCASVEIDGYDGYYLYTGTPTYSTKIRDIKASDFQAIGTTQYTCNTIFDVDRTDSRLIKIFKLPYSPVDYNMEEGTFNGGWIYDSSTKLPVLQDLNTRFSNIMDVVNPIAELDASGLDFHDSVLRNKAYESKLYHSDYFYNKYVYDSFGYIFALENVDVESYQETFKLGFNMTSTLNSKFMFTFPSLKLRFSSEDYDGIMLVARNNEEVIYSSAYADYIKTGYNYDVKNRERSIGMNILGASLNIGGTIGSLATGNPFGIGMGTGAISSVVGAVNSAINGEMQLKQKIDQLKMQSTSVSGSDDVDLMSVYTNNKIKMVQYRCSENMEKALYDLFFYTGYKCDYLGIPNRNSRIRFNFVACEPVFENDCNQLDEEIRQELFDRYQSGVTFIHKYKGTWDLDQQYENFETSIVEEEENE